MKPIIAKEIAKHRRELEDEIHSALEKFSKSTGLPVTSINFEVLAASDMEGDVSEIAYYSMRCGVTL